MASPQEYNYTIILSTDLELIVILQDLSFLIIPLYYQVASHIHVSVPVYPLKVSRSQVNSTTLVLFVHVCNHLHHIEPKH